MKEAMQREQASHQRQRAGTATRSPSQGPAAAIHDSPRLVAQRLALAGTFGGAAPRANGASRGPTGLPFSLKAGIASLSGMDLSDVRVHENSAKPAQLNALAYAQGSDIHMGPGQMEHLPHEAWHIVQQRQGRVGTTQRENGVEINDNVSLEREATEMGERAARTSTFGAADLRSDASPKVAPLATAPSQLLRPIKTADELNAADAYELTEGKTCLDSGKYCLLIDTLFNALGATRAMFNRQTWRDDPSCREKTYPPIIVEFYREAWGKGIIGYSFLQLGTTVKKRDEFADLVREYIGKAQSKPAEKQDASEDPGIVDAADKYLGYAGIVNTALGKGAGGYETVTGRSTQPVVDITDKVGAGIGLYQGVRALPGQIADVGDSSLTDGVRAREGGELLANLTDMAANAALLSGQLGEEALNTVGTVAGLITGSFDIAIGMFERIRNSRAMGGLSRLSADVHRKVDEEASLAATIQMHIVELLNSAEEWERAANLTANNFSAGPFGDPEHHNAIWKKEECLSRAAELTKQYNGITIRIAELVKTKLGAELASRSKEIKRDEATGRVIAGAATVVGSAILLGLGLSNPVGLTLLVLASIVKVFFAGWSWWCKQKSYIDLVYKVYADQIEDHLKRWNDGKPAENRKGLCIAILQKNGFASLEGFADHYYEKTGLYTHTLLTKAVKEGKTADPAVQEAVKMVEALGLKVSLDGGSGSIPSADRIVEGLKK